MAMKYIELFKGWPSRWSRKFKWQWAIEYDSKFDPPHRYLSRRNFSSREEARQYKRQFENYGAENVVIKRRLVQVDWEDYSDSFTWNKGCGKR